jgi:NADH:ubiquinone oxidoreductase subunit K
MKREWTLDRRTIWTAIVRHRWWIVIYLILNVLDSVTTYVGLQQGATELNPIASFLMGMSFSLSTVVKFAIVLFAVLISAIVNHRKMFILKLMTLGIGVAVWLNLVAVLRYSVGGVQHQAGRADPASFAIFIAIITGISLVAYVLARLASRFRTKRRQRVSHSPHQ